MKWSPVFTRVIKLLLILLVITLIARSDLPPDKLNRVFLFLDRIESNNTD
jgi:hypothetical protein